ncbi:unnamed protein product [Lactuca saligna]|uniref:Uncharacterized protein n=1 Tax=Lactuca saligna TaxID=75948 RepID=A0AA35YMN4_LACSI|nr:unnamed protein product [Lactuca saligna]
MGLLLLLLSFVYKFHQTSTFLGWKFDHKRSLPTPVIGTNRDQQEKDGRWTTGVASCYPVTFDVAAALNHQPPPPANPFYYERTQEVNTPHFILYLKKNARFLPFLPLYANTRLQNYAPTFRSSLLSLPTVDHLQHRSPPPVVYLPEIDSHHDFRRQASTSLSFLLPSTHSPTSLIYNTSPIYNHLLPPTLILPPPPASTSAASDDDLMLQVTSE